MRIYSQNTILKMNNIEYSEEQIKNKRRRLCFQTAKMATHQFKSKKNSQTKGECENTEFYSKILKLTVKVKFLYA